MRTFWAFKKFQKSSKFLRRNFVAVSNARPFGESKRATMRIMICTIFKKTTVGPEMDRFPPFGTPFFGTDVRSFHPGTPKPFIPAFDTRFRPRNGRIPQFGSPFLGPEPISSRDPNIPAFDTRFRPSTVVVKKMVHRKNERAPGKRPTELFLDISATILLCRITFQRHLAPLSPRACTRTQEGPAAPETTRPAGWGC